MLMLLSVKTLTTEQLDNSNDFIIGHNSPDILISQAVPVVLPRRGTQQGELKSNWLTIILSAQLFYYLDIFFCYCGHFNCPFN